MYDVVLIKGDGIGPEISDAVVAIVNAAGAPINWIEREAGLGCTSWCPSGLPDETIEAVQKYGVALKGPTTTPIGTGHKSVNVTLRKRLDLYSNVRPARSLPGVLTRYKNVDMVIVRENIEDTYAGVEHMQSADVAQGLKMITRPGSLKICRYAFEMARATGRSTVTAFHKANIHKLTDGLFLESFREVSKHYPDIQTRDILVDNLCMQLVTAPEQFDVLVGTNLYGDIISDLCAGLVGGLGVAPGGNIGDKQAVFEAVHGSAPDIAGQGLANPTALLLSAIMMLRHLGLIQTAQRIQDALDATMKDGVKTKDLGGSAGTAEFTKAVIDRLPKRAPSLPDEIPQPMQIFSGNDELSHKNAKVECVGVDIFVMSNEGMPVLPESFEEMNLHFISNRGTKIYPGPMPDALLVNTFTARYFGKKEDGKRGLVSDEHIQDLLSMLVSQGIHWVHVEKLLRIDGVEGFSKAQGE